MSEHIRPINFENFPVDESQPNPETREYRETIRELQERLERLRQEAEVRAESLADQSARMKETGIETQEREANKEILKPRKRVISFVGLPGAGKSTQIAEVQGALGAPIFHVGTYAKEKGVADNDRRKRGELLEGLDEMFLQEVVNAPDESIILDGYPRSTNQAEKLFELADRNSWQLETVHLTFPKGKEVEESYARQLSRAKKEGVATDNPRFFGKITRGIADDMAAIQAVRRIGGKIVEVDCMKTPEEVSQEIREQLGLDFDSLPWEKDVLDSVQEVSKRIGVELWLAAGAIYRPFWNGKFGPYQESTDKDVSVGREEDIEPVLKALNEAKPDIRWSVKAGPELVQRHRGKKSIDVVDAAHHDPLTFRKGLVRINNDQLDTKLANGSEADLRNGIVRLDEALLGTLDDEHREKTLEESLARTRKVLEEYPGLRLEGKLVELYAAKYGEHTPVSILTTWEEIQEEVWEQEHGGRAVWRSKLFSEEEKRIAEEVRDFYRTTEKKPSSPPRPKKSSLPGNLENVRLTKEKAEKGAYLSEHERGLLGEAVAPPEGYRSWLEYATAEATDAEFREWMLNQIRSRNPIGGRDFELRDILEFVNTEENRKISEDEEQKITHMGFRLHKHLEETALQLETDHFNKLVEEAGLDVNSAKRFRQQMRMAMICHDLGKLLNVNTPGSHEGIGAKMWLKLKPSWVREEDAKAISWMIRSHDLFGRLARGITEKEGKKINDPDFDVTSATTYKGALDPEAVRHELEKSGLPISVALAIHKTIWRADVSSVSSLRWILPVADKLEQMVTTGIKSR